MAHYEIDYSEHADEASKRVAALADIEDYLGEAKFKYLTDEFSKFGKDAMPVERMELMLTLAGISGYPVQAWHHYIFEKDEDGFNAYERMQLA
jgi:hypothetical protein